MEKNKGTSRVSENWITVCKSLAYVVLGSIWALFLLEVYTYYGFFAFFVVWVVLVGLSASIELI